MTVNVDFCVSLLVCVFMAWFLCVFETSGSRRLRRRMLCETRAFDDDDRKRRGRVKNFLVGCVVCCSCCCWVFVGA